MFPPLRFRLSWCKSSAGSATGRERKRARGLPPPPSSPSFPSPHSSPPWSTWGHIYDRFPDFHEKFMRGLPFSLLPPFYPFRSSFLLPYLICCPPLSSIRPAHRGNAARKKGVKLSTLPKYDPLLALFRTWLQGSNKRERRRPSTAFRERKVRG